MSCTERRNSVYIERTTSVEITMYPVDSTIPEKVNSVPQRETSEIVFLLVFDNLR